MAAFLAAFGELDVAAWRARLATLVTRRQWNISISWVGLSLALVLAVGIFFRFYQLDRIPAEMTSDHAEKLLDVYDVLHGQHRIFFPRNTGREAFQFYLTAFLIRYLGFDISHIALKVGTSLFGVFAIPFAFLLARELYDDLVGVLAAALLAVSFWHVAITRVGLRFPFTAAFATPTLYFLFRGFKYGRRNDWLLAGLFLGIGLHTYTAMRVVPILVAALVGLKLAWDLGVRLLKREASDAGEVSALTWDFWGNVALTYIMMLLAFMPLLRYMVDEPRMFWYRVLTRSGNLEHPVPQSKLMVFLGNVKNALLMFNVRGDQVWVNTIPGRPVLDYVTGALFVLGVVWLLWYLVRRGERTSAYVMVCLFMLLLPSILSLSFPNENPSVVRAGGAVVIATLIAALPLAFVARRVRVALGEGGGWVAGVMVVLLLLVIARANYHMYFIEYDEQFRRSAWNSTEMGEVVRGFANSVGDMAHVWHIAYPYWVDTRNIAINAGDITWNQAILDVEQIRSHAADPYNKLYILYPQDQRAIQVLREVFPEGQLRQHPSRTPGKEFLTYFVPGKLQGPG